MINAGMGILFDRAGSLWTTNNNGVQRLRFPEKLTTGTIGPSSEGVESFTVREGLTAATLEGFPVMEDREGNIWVGTETGLDRFRPTNLVPSSFPVRNQHQPRWRGGGQGKDLDGIFVGARRQIVSTHSLRGRPFPFQLDLPVNVFLSQVPMEPSGSGWEIAPYLAL